MTLTIKDDKKRVLALGRVEQNKVPRDTWGTKQEVVVPFEAKEGFSSKKKKNNSFQQVELSGANFAVDHKFPFSQNSIIFLF